MVSNVKVYNLKVFVVVVVCWHITSQPKKCQARAETKQRQQRATIYIMFIIHSVRVEWSCIRSHIYINLIIIRSLLCYMGWGSSIHMHVNVCACVLLYPVQQYIVSKRGPARTNMHTPKTSLTSFYRAEQSTASSHVPQQRLLPRIWVVGCVGWSSCVCVCCV